MVQDGGSTKKNLTLSMPILIGNIPLRPADDASYSGGSVAGSMIQSSLGNGSNNQKLKASSITDYPNLRMSSFYQDIAIYIYLMLQPSRGTKRVMFFPALMAGPILLQNTSLM